MQPDLTQAEADHIFVWIPLTNLCKLRPSPVTIHLILYLYSDRDETPVWPFTYCFYAFWLKEKAANIFLHVSAA